MDSFYGEDLAYIHATAFSGSARGAAPEILRRFAEASIPVRCVVDAGCGAGSLSVELSAAGYQVTGIDVSTSLLDAARSTAPAAAFIHGSVYDIPFPPCQAIVAVGEPLTYHADPQEADQRVQNFFRSAAATLPAGGLLIFDVIELGEPALTNRSWFSADDWAVLVDTCEDQAERSLCRTIETYRRVDDLFRRHREVHHVRLFDAHLLTQQLLDCGFETETATSYGSHRLSPRRRVFFCTRTT